MLPDLARRFSLLEERKSDILARVDALSEEQRAAPVLPGEWSPVQLIHHLVLAEEQGGEQIAAASEAGERHRRGRPSPFVLSAVAVMRLGIRVPVPDTMVPLGDVPLDALTERWAAARRALRARLEALDAQTQNDSISLHPLAGPIDAAEVLSLHEVHLLYHQRQFARQRRAARKQKGLPP